MPRTISIEQAASRLEELVTNLEPGGEIVLTKDDQAVARIVGPAPTVPARREPGACRGTLTILSDDDEHLEHFKDYVPWECGRLAGNHLTPRSP